MPRIFKGSESTLRLLISKTGDYQALTEIKIKLYTTDIENAIEIIDGIQVCKNIAIITLAPRAFMGMEDGLINYIIDGATEDDVFHTERQSNYMLKSLSYINEDGVATQTMTIESNGEYRVTPNDGLYVDINVNVPDLNGSYDDGFNVGYGQGKTDGVNEQKSKLESINITENGTYTKEDGYNQIEVNVPDLNGSYDEGHRDGEQAGYNSGYTQGQADVAAKARVLNVTENGNYLSKFSDPVIPANVTGVYADGTEFYSYATVKSAIYNTNIILAQDSKITIWVNLNEKGTGESHFILLSNMQEREYDTNFLLIRYNTDRRKMEAIICGNSIYFDVPQGWCKMKISITDGLWVNDVKISDFQSAEIVQQPIWINGSFAYRNRNINGEFGMIKIDDVVIIPTADGFQNVNTGGLLEVVQNGSYIYTNNEIIQGEGELYKTINVNVIPKINLQKTGLKLGFSSFTEVPEWADFEGITNMVRMFSECLNLQTIPEINTSGVTNMERMFYNCGIQTIPFLDTSNVGNANGMFYYCGKLKTLPNNFNFGKCTNLSDMFNSAGLTDYSFLETWVINPNASMDNMINNTNTTYVPAIPCVGNTSYFQSAIFWTYGDYSKLTYFGGWIGRKYNVTQGYMLNKMPNLSYESCISILNNLYDFTGNGETPDSSQGQLKVHQNFLDKVGEEISIGTNKGWTITV